MKTLTDQVKEDAWRALRAELSDLLSVIRDRADSLDRETTEKQEWRRFWLDWFDPPFQAEPAVEELGQSDRMEERIAFAGEEPKSLLPDALRRCIEGISDAIKNKDVRAVKEHVDWLQEYCEENVIDSDGWHFMEIYASIDVLGVSEGTVIYAPDRVPLHSVPDVIVAVNDELLQLIARKPDLLFRISPRRFEEVIAEVFFRNGYEVQLTKATRDGGRDIVAIQKQMGIASKYLIECKRYSSARRVSIAVVQRLLGVKIAERANKAILATTSTFTRDARRFASTHLWDLDLKDYNDILAWVRSCERLV